MKKVKTLTFGISLLLSISNAESGTQLSFIVEHANYGNDFNMKPSFVFSSRFVKTVPIIKKIGIQFSFSKMPFFIGNNPWLYKDKVSWYAISIVKPISFNTNSFGFSFYTGLGMVYQSTWHDDLVYENDEDGCFGCGDYYTPPGFYLDYEIHAEIDYLVTQQLEIGIGFAFRNFLGPGGLYTDVHNPPLLGNSIGTYLTIGRNFSSK